MSVEALVAVAKVESPYLDRLVCTARDSQFGILQKFWLVMAIRRLSSFCMFNRLSEGVRLKA